MPKPPRPPADTAAETTARTIPSRYVVDQVKLAEIRTALISEPVYETRAMKQKREALERAEAVSAVLGELRDGIVAMHTNNWSPRKITEKVNALLEGLTVPVDAVRALLVDAGRLQPREKRASDSAG